MSQEHIIQRSLVRPDQIWGCERPLILVVSLLATLLIVVAQNMIAALLGGLIWCCAIWALRRLAAADPQMSKVYLRHIQYRVYYPALSSVRALSADYR